jgi:hypothetical protein
MQSDNYIYLTNVKNVMNTKFNGNLFCNFEAKNMVWQIYVDDLLIVC